MPTVLSFITKLLVLAAEAPSSASGAVPSGAAPAPPSPGENPFGLLVMILPMIGIFYFLIWRPESRRRKQQENLLGALKPKDKVVTIGGLHGTVVDLDKDDVVLLVDPKKDIKLKFRRSAISAIENAPASPALEPEKK